MKVIVVGAGAAGVAAAWRATRQGASVRLLHAHAGSSELSSGAVDLVPWTQRVPALPSAAARAFADDFGLWSLQSETMLATGSGVIRPALGADRALLNLAPLAGRTIALPLVERDDWDAELLVRALRDSSWAHATGTRFECVAVPLLQEGYERRISAHDFASAHDAPARRQWLCERLGNASAPDAWLLGPWLGVEPVTAASIERTLGVPIGEVTSLPGGPAGARFARAREELCVRLAIDAQQTRVAAVKRRGERWEATLADGRTLNADGVVLALGGVAGGGVVLESPAAQASHSSFVLSLDAPVEVCIKKRRAENVASAHGFDFAAHGLGVLDQVGARLRDAQGLELAGDVMAGRPNTVLMAVETGALAADAVLAQDASVALDRAEPGR